MTHNDTKAILQILYKNFANSKKLTKIPKNIQNNIQKPCFLNAKFYTIISIYSKEEIKMKFLKISLAASLALGALSTASFAQPLEEAIKGVDVSGYLRYRYTDDRYDNAGFLRDSLGDSNARHQWRAEADFKTPTINNVSLDLGILYRNDSQNVNHGNVDGLGSGLGAGQDSDFGVSQFYMTIAPDSTATTILIGKQKLGTPVTNPGDGDRGTGILALNSDIPGLTLAAGAFDSWAIDDLNATSYVSGTQGSVDKPLYTLAAIYGVDTSIGNIGAQVWFFNVTDMVDAMIYSELSWKHSVFNASLQYGYASLKDGNDAFLTRELASDNDLLNLRIGANFKEYNVPLGIQLGYLTNFQDGTTVSVDDEGAWTPSIGGKLWWQNNATGVTFGLAQNINANNNGGDRMTPWGQETDLSVFHGVIDYTFLDGRFKIGLEGAFGENETTISTTGATTYKTKFTEITPTVAWKHSKNLTISGFYAMLSTEDDMPNSTEPDEDRNRARVEVKYTF